MGKCFIVKTENGSGCGNEIPISELFPNKVLYLAERTDEE